MNIGFDNEKYQNIQSEHIKERISQFDGKLYLELGGKLFDDHHASRVLPGFQPDSKLRMFQKISDSIEIVIVISATDIEKNKKRADLGITYDEDVLRLRSEFQNRGFMVGSVVITHYNGQPAAIAFKQRLERSNIKTYCHYLIEGYPHDVKLIASDNGFGKNDYVKTERPLVIVTAPGPGSGKMAVGWTTIDGNKYYFDEETGVMATGDVTIDGDAINDEYLKSLSEDQLKQLLKEEEQYLSLLKQKYGDGDYMVRYVQNTTTGEYEPYFYKLDNLQNANYDANGNSQSNINCYKIGTETKTEEVKAVEGCEIEKDSSGRYINMTIKDASGNKITYALTTTTATDQAAYDDAMNQYEYEKYEYDQAIQDINSKIEIIQSEDKNLELRLKQLDTEQDAIQTEMDAVQKVIEKNTESTFKTFGQTRSTSTQLTTA